MVLIIFLNMFHSTPLGQVLIFPDAKPRGSLRPMPVTCTCPSAPITGGRDDTGPGWVRGTPHFLDPLPVKMTKSNSHTQGHLHSGMWGFTSAVTKRGVLSPPAEIISFLLLNRLKND